MTAALRTHVEPWMDLFRWRLTFRGHVIAEGHRATECGARAAVDERIQAWQAALSRAPVAEAIAQGLESGVPLCHRCGDEGVPLPLSPDDPASIVWLCDPCLARLAAA